MALTRIVELYGGRIEIDGVDIAKLELADLRNQITMIPQDPVMFSGTLRFNLDPFDEASDDRIIDLIKKANLEYILEGKSKQELEQEDLAEKKKAQQHDSDENTATKATETNKT